MRVHIKALGRLSRDITQVVDILTAMNKSGVELYVDGERYDLEAFASGMRKIEQK